MLKRIVIFGGSITVLLLITFGILWKFAGLNEYVQFLKYFNALVEEGETEVMLNTFFNGTDGQYTGGIISKINSSGVWLWGEKGLRYLQFTDGATYSFIKNCTPNVEGKVNVTYKSFSSFEDWLNESGFNPGMHAFLYLNGKKVEFMLLNPDIRPWYYPTYFCHYEYK